MVETTSSETGGEVRELVFHFSKGIPGFEALKEFAYVPFPEGPFAHLQSTQEENIAFVLIDPFVFYPDYQFELPEHIAEELSLDNDFFIRCMVTIQEDISRSTVNLMAPLVFNRTRLEARQIILHQSSYQTKSPLWIQAPTDADKGGE